MKSAQCDAHLAEQFGVLIESGHFPHAVILEGGTAEERKVFIEDLITALLCEAESGRPCEECYSCRKVRAFSHPDAVFIRPEEGRKTLSVDSVRKISETIHLVPNEGRYKIYIIEDAALMQDYAQNALLKILEEPPSYVIFILSLESKTALLPTVLSRSACFTINSSQSVMTDDRPYKEAVDSMADALIRKNEWQLLSAVSYFEKNYDELPEALDRLSVAVRDAAVYGAGGKSMIYEPEDTGKRLSGVYSEEELLSLLEAINSLNEAINMYSNKNLTLTRVSSLLMQAGNP